MTDRTKTICPRIFNLGGIITGGLDRTFAPKHTLMTFIFLNQNILFLDLYLDHIMCKLFVQEH